MSRRASTTFIFFTLLLDVLGFGLLIPVAPKLVERFLGLPEYGQEGKAAWAVATLAAIYAGMQFILSPVLGSLSDRFGRRPVLLVALLGSGLDYLAAAAAAIWFPHIWLLFLTRAINGASGASISTCYAYIADVTPPEKRAGAYGMMGAAFGLGFMIGPLLGGVLGDAKTNIPLIGPGALHYPFIAAGVLTLINWLYGVFVLPESLARENRRPFSWAKANPLGALAWLWSAGSGVVRHLAGSAFLLNVAQFGLHVTWVLSMSNRFKWTPSQVGWSLFIVGLSAALVQGLLARKIIPKIGERASLLIGIFIAIVAFIGYGVATESWMVYAIIAIASFGGIAGPALQSMTTKAVAPNEQGLLQGALASINCLATMIGAFIASQIFAAFTSDHPPGGVTFAGAPFISGSILCAVALVPIVMIWSRLPRNVTQSKVTPFAGERPCKKCGYELAGLGKTDVCPECGTAQRSEA